ncbi:hypothetical protein QBZ16_001557 [Prototheca wickerhamii]|uniref:Uncharacterized protein n=1 Tax=Prototheca wickerhamii TaxID=3111 RepID=A0AAD9ID79_PROWI|nr:hypothetical protein QBZ16_001557 [Prototheca wickerhamii]
MDPVAAWYRFRGRVSSLDLVLIGSAAAVLLGGLVILDEAFSGAWRAFNTGRLYEDVRAERHLRQLALLEKLRAERQRLESTATKVEEGAEDVERA